MKIDHNKFLQECFRLAKLGESKTFPNPIVGCVIVHEGKIIGSGFHEVYGGAHAEVNALRHCEHEASLQGEKTNAVIARSEATWQSTYQKLLENSTIYISLEPCSHHGKTPPCADLIIKHKFKTLVYAALDPNPLVAGKGIAKIKAAGIEVIGPEDLDPEIVTEAESLNKAFYKIVSGGKYFITCKVALDKDGKMFTQPGVWQTGEDARKQVHRMRSCHQLLITSSRTVLVDDPEYNVRFSAEELGLAEIKNPDILILKSITNFTDEQKDSLRIFNPKYNRKVFEACISESGDYQDLETCLDSMANKGYQKIMVEAGPTLSKAFLDEDLVDDYVEFR